MTAGTSNILVGVAQDILVVGGGMILTAMMATGSATMPSLPIVIAALLTGAIQAARRAQSKVEPSVVQRAARTPEQLSAQIKDREAAIAAAVELALRAREVTPKRIEVPPEPPPVIAGPGVTRVPRERDLPGGSS